MTSHPGDEGALYLACWAGNPYQHAGHYLGFAYPGDPERADPAILAEIEAAMHTLLAGRPLTGEQAAGVALRIAQHRAGTGARLLAVVIESGRKIEITRIWAGATEHHEKGLKDTNNRVRLCPRCNPGTRAGTRITPKQYRRRRQPAAVLAA